ncbi:unnamed protein product [Arabis nemorensis]|uniref:Uncharacterized protein n=1 Tax=Arabis nemorensis TaxID=586526 RepID=A0A565BW29_9BRAS|nr:unnamed protein product [Arabis nemorensis]
MNIQDIVFQGEGAASLNQILQVSRQRFLFGREIQKLMVLVGNLPDSPVPVAPLIQGLYRRDCNEYVDQNQWIPTGQGGRMSRSDTLKVNGQVAFNYMEARLNVAGGSFRRRTIRRSEHQFGTLVHYLFIPHNRVSLSNVVPCLLCLWNVCLLKQQGV